MADLNFVEGDSVNMSMRPEDAAREASRFSLRTAFIGDEYNRARVPATALMATTPKTTTPAMDFKFQKVDHSSIPVMEQRVPTETVPAVPSKGFTFNFINGPSTSVPHSSSSLGVPPHTSTVQVGTSAVGQEAMRRIAQIQMQQRTKTLTPNVHRTESVEGTTRVLNRGYINGGSTQEGASAEIIRLSALVDSLTTKLDMQNERLQRTEASLVKANRSMTSERATHNGRMLRMQTEMKELKVSETKLKEKLSIDVKIRNAHASTFEQSIRKAEEIESQMEAYQTTVDMLQKQLLQSKRETGEATSQAHVLTAECATLSDELAATKAFGEEQRTLVSAALAERDAAQKEAMSFSSSVCSTDAHTTDVLQQKLSSTTMEYEKLLVQKDKTVEEISKARDELELSYNTVLDEKSKIMESIQSLTLARDEALEKAESLSQKVLAHEKQVVDTYATVARLTSELESTRATAAKDYVKNEAGPPATGCGIHYGYDGNDTASDSDDENDNSSDEEYKNTPTYAYYDPALEESPTEKQNPWSSGTVHIDPSYYDKQRKRANTGDTFKSTLHRLICTEGRTQSPVQRANPPWLSSYLLGNATAAAFAVERVGEAEECAVGVFATAESNEANKANAKIKAMVKAVSWDITKACVSQRRSYLKATGMSDDEIEAEIAALES